MMARDDVDTRRRQFSKHGRAPGDVLRHGLTLNVAPARPRNLVGLVGVVGPEPEFPRFLEEGSGRGNCHELHMGDCLLTGEGYEI